MVQGLQGFSINKLLLAPTLLWALLPHVLQTWLYFTRNSPSMLPTKGTFNFSDFLPGLCLCSPSSFRSFFLDQGWVRDSLMARGTDHTSAIAGLPCSLNCIKCLYFPLYLVPGTKQALKKNCWINNLNYCLTLVSPGLIKSLMKLFPYRSVLLSCHCS